MLPNGGTLLFTGATMSVRAGAKFSAMAPAMFARRALAQSLAREFGPQGIHVCHVIVDGIIDTPRVQGMMGAGKGEDTRLQPDDIAQVCLSIFQFLTSRCTCPSSTSLARHGHRNWTSGRFECISTDTSPAKETF